MSELAQRALVAQHLLLVQRGLILLQMPEQPLQLQRLQQVAIVSL